MSYLILLLLTSCTHVGLYTKNDVVRINTALIKEQQKLCGDLICESSEDLTRPEVVMRLLAEALEHDWLNTVGTEYYNEDYEKKGWRE